MEPPDQDPAQPPGPGAAFFRVLLENYTDAIVVLGEDGAIRYATPPAAALFRSERIIGARLPDLVGDDARPGVARAVNEMLSPAGTAPGPGEQTWQVGGPHGQAVHLEVRISDLRAAPAVNGVVLTLRDVTGQRRTEDELRRLALHDELTGLPTRRLFADRARHAVTVASRAGTTAAIMFADLDDFKAVNDTLGHGAGDEVLASAAARLAGAVRDSDTTARLGGDEFAVVLENLRGPAAAGAFADRVIRAFAAPFDLAAGQVSVGISVGLATSADAGDVAGLLACADLALAAAKSAGKRGWRAYHPAMARSGPARAARPAGLDFPDPRPGLAGNRAPGTTALSRPATPRKDRQPGRNIP